MGKAGPGGFAHKVSPAHKVQQKIEHIIIDSEPLNTDSKDAFTEPVEVNSMKTVFFDLETQYLFEELGLDRRDPRAPAKLKLWIAGILPAGGQPAFFMENNVDDLFRALGQADTIVGHNLFRFDYVVLSPYTEMDVSSSFRAKTIDMMLEIDKRTGCWTGLDSLCDLNLGIKKTMDPRKIPKMIREGKHAEVREYLLNDLKMTEAIYNHGRKLGKLKYEHKEYGESKGVREVSIQW